LLKILNETAHFPYLRLTTSKYIVNGGQCTFDRFAFRWWECLRESLSFVTSNCIAYALQRILSYFLPSITLIVSLPPTRKDCLCDDLNNTSTTNVLISVFDAMIAIQGGWRTAFLIFFISHIPITILIDGQAVFSPLYPRFLVDVVASYADCFGDVLMGKAPSLELIWFSAVVGCEIICQLPFFFVATKMLLSYPKSKTIHRKPNPTSTSYANYDDSNTYPAWFRTACLIYGSHVTTTLVPIMATIIASTETSISQKCTTLAIYSPYLIFPVTLTWLAAREDVDTPRPKMS
jgi:hypothetical protein